MQSMDGSGRPKSSAIQDSGSDTKERRESYLGRGARPGILWLVIWPSPGVLPSDSHDKVFARTSLLAHSWGKENAHKGRAGIWLLLLVAAATAAAAAAGTRSLGAASCWLPAAAGLIRKSALNWPADCCGLLAG